MNMQLSRYRTTRRICTSEVRIVRKENEAQLSRRGSSKPRARLRPILVIPGMSTEREFGEGEKERENKRKPGKQR